MENKKVKMNMGKDCASREEPNGMEFLEQGREHS